MGHYRKIDPKIWNDAKFNNMSPNGQLACFFMLTHPHMTAVGGLRATVQGLASEHQKLSEKAFREAFTEGLVESDKTAPLIWFPNFIKYNPPESPNVVKAWIKALDYLPECDTKSLIIQNIKDFLKGFSEAFQEAFALDLPKDLPLSGAGAGTGDKPPPPQKPNCPYKEIIALYHETLPSLQVVKATESLNPKIKARWQADKTRQNLDWWKDYFEDISRSDFLMGRIKDFTATLTWLVGTQNMDKVLNGYYINKNGSSGSYPSKALTPEQLKGINQKDG